MVNTPNQTTASDEERLRSTYQTCIRGSHILHYNGVLDAYGHLSARHPTDPGIFIMPCNLAPANVASPGHLVQYRVADASPVDPGAPHGYIERFIHSEIYKKFPTVGGVVHSHAPEVIPYGNTKVCLRPCIHMAGFLGANIPTFDISQHYVAGDTRDLLIRNVRLGENLADSFDSSDSPEALPVVLMRGHGCTIVGATPQEAIYRAIYTKTNAAIQTASLGLAFVGGARGDAGSGGPDVEYLRDDELQGTLDMSRFGWGRAWGLWLREVEAAGLYKYEE